MTFFKRKKKEDTCLTCSQYKNGTNWKNRLDDASMLSINSIKNPISIFCYLSTSKLQGTTKPWQLFFNNGQLAQMYQSLLFFSQINKMPGMDHGVWFNIKYWWKKVDFGYTILKSIWRPLNNREDMRIELRHSVWK